MVKGVPDCNCLPGDLFSCALFGVSVRAPAAPSGRDLRAQSGTVYKDLVVAGSRWRQRRTQDSAGLGR